MQTSPKRLPMGGAPDKSGEQPQTPTTPVEMSALVTAMVEPPDTKLQKLRQRMGSNAPLLEYLRPDLVRLLQFDDRKKERMTALPVRMYFGHIRNGRYSSTDVCVLLHTSEDRSRPSEQRFNLFSRHGNLEGSIKANDAVRRATCASAFRCITEYFITKGIKLPMAWTLDTQFVDSLVAACRLARANVIKQGPTKDKGLSVAAATIRDPGSFFEAQSSPSRSEHASTLINAPTCTPATTPMILNLHVPPDTSALNSDGLSHSNKGYEPHKCSLQDRLYGDNANQSLQISEVSSMSVATNYVPSLIHRMTGPRSPVNAEPTTDVSRSGSIDTVQTEHSVLFGNEAENFMSSYRKMLADSDALTEYLNTNKIQQDELAGQIQILQDKVLTLKEEEKTIKNEQRQFRVKKKSLRQSLPARDRMMLEFGRELAARKGLDMNGSSYNFGSEPED